MIKCEKGHELSAVYHKTKSTTSHDARKLIEDILYCPDCKKFYKQESKAVPL